MTPTKQAWLNGYIDGLKDFAWWKDGIQYVGVCGMTLAEAIAQAKREYGEPKGGPDDGE